ncbi:endonuclease [Vibrio phage pYD21-A]|uniref:endonuclease n=1 Tax=Vibrio phage pYD21-A TaxID=754049 RepID=UPI0002C08156|nr:endonuclease [Vibrio phage pYD21-A]AGH16048.1 endonuclease [Vibrio phage pYD21-A]
MPSQESLKKLFNYHEDGFFVRKIPRGTQKAGSECRGKMEASGYRRMPINHDLYLAHRLIWKWHYGTEPECIDHINHDRGDNRIENLRSVTRGENCQHQLLPCNNSSGYFGVRYYDYDYMPQSPCWSAQITVNSEKIHIGYFNDKLSAVKAYNEACDKIHGEFGKDKIQHNIAKLKEEGLLK